MLRLLAALVGCASTLVLAGADVARAAFDLTAVDQVTFSWEPAVGPVASYAVFVQRDGGDEVLHSLVFGATEETVRGEPGETLTVRVAARDTDGQLGPFSPSSDPILFVAPDEEPPPDPGGDPEPPPDEEPPPVAPATPGDFDGDGAADVVLRDPDTGHVTLFRFDGQALVPLRYLARVDPDIALVGTNDLDGNGAADLLWHDAATGKAIAWLLEGGSVSGAVAVDAVLGASWEVFAGGDHDGDGRDEIFLRHAEAGLLQRLSLEGSGFVVIDEREGAPGPAWRPAGAGDLDGDHVAELLWVDDAGALAAWHLSDLGAIDEEAVGALPAQFAAAGVGDFDGDGLCGLLAHSPEGLVEVHAPYAPQPVSVLPDAVSGAEVFDTGDYDGDGVRDILWSTGGAPAYELWLLDGSGGAEVVALADPLATVPDEEPANDACEADLNGDGIVGLSDLGVLRSCFGDDVQGGCTAADLNGDGTVGIRDFRIFRSAFGARGCSAP